MMYVRFVELLMYVQRACAMVSLLCWKLLEFHDIQFVLLLHFYSMEYGYVVETGMGSPRGLIPRSGTGMGQTQAPTVLTGTGTGKFYARGDEDGEPSSDGEFPVAIPIPYNIF